MATFQLWLDASLVTPCPNPIPFTQSTDGSIAPVDLQLWAGLTDAGRLVQEKLNPGVNQITISSFDSAIGTGFSTSGVKLALTQGGLAGATPGASLNIGLSIASGAGNAVPFWVRVTSSGGVERVESDVHLKSNDCLVYIV